MALSNAPVLADSVGPGGTAAIVVFALIIACVGIFIAFAGSLKRLRGNVAKGTFNAHGTPPPDQGAAAEATPDDKAVSRDPGGQPGAGA